MGSTLSKERIHFLVEGRVQGVGFRAFARTQAEELKLIGWVRNLGDGRVEGLAAGEEAAIKEFVKRVQKGPAHGEVRSFKIEKLAIQNENENMGFRILKNGESEWDGL
jgi:acylphosphatase